MLLLKYISISILEYMFIIVHFNDSRPIDIRSNELIIDLIKSIWPQFTGVYVNVHIIMNGVVAFKLICISY